MMRSVGNRFVLAVALGMALGASSQTRAGILLDHSPGTTGATLEFSDGNPWSNDSTSQNFADTFRFGTAETLSGMDIYTSTAFPSVGMSVTVRLWADSGGLPGALLDNFTTTVTAVDSVGTVPGTDDVRVHADFTLDLAANTTYWIGMSGTNAELGQYGLSGPNAPGDGGMAQFKGTTFEGFAPTIGNMAFRLEGPASAVPEPSSFVLASGSIGIIALGLAWRRRKGRIDIAVD
jgi:PEP-CTERM motif